MSKKRNILITGARGFIGKNLVEYLGGIPDKYAVFNPYHKELELTDKEKVTKYTKEHDIDTIIHGANVGGSRKSGYDSNRRDIIETNLAMFNNLAGNMDTAKQMIFLGSGAEYDRAHYIPRMKEEYFGEHKPTDDYGLSKYLCSKIIERSGNMANLRIFGMFGKYEDYEFKFISNAIVKNLLKLPIIINQNVKFDYMYIEDGIRIIEKFINIQPKHNAYNLTTGTTVDLVTIANKINAVSDFKSDIIINNPGFITEYSGDNSRLMKEINYKFTPIDSAIKELFAYYRSILPTIDHKIIEKDEYVKYCFTNKEACREE